MYVAGIETFLAIVQTQNLKRAAALLNLTQATVSYRLRILEQEMGSILIERGKGMQKATLTPFGESFVVIAERWHELKRDIEELQIVDPELSLVIGGSNSLNTYVLPRLYRALSQHSPKMRLQFRTQHSTELWEALERREIDIAFVKMERRVPNIEVQPFFVDEVVLIRSTTRETRNLRPIHPTELTSEHEIYFNWGPAFKMWHDRWWDPLRPAYTPVDNAGLIFTLMQDSRQWSVVPKSVADTFLGSGKFAIQQLLDSPPDRICYKITHKQTRPSARKSLAILDRYMASLFKA